MILSLSSLNISILKLKLIPILVLELPILKSLDLLCVSDPQLFIAIEVKKSNSV